MSSRMFQGVVLQMKDNISRTVGVVDSEGIVVACSELTCIGEHWSGAVAAINGADNGLARYEGRTFKPLVGWGAQFDYAAFVKGEDEMAASLCAMAVVAFNGAKTYYEEKHDKATFVKNIISDNILLGDIYTQAKELHFVSEVPRAAFLVRQLGPADVSTIDIIQNLFPDKNKDFVFNITETDIVLVKEVKNNIDVKDLEKLARSISDTLSSEFFTKVNVGIGTPVLGVKELARSFKEAQTALEVGKVFDTDKNIVSYDNLGIASLNQLKTLICKGLADTRHQFRSRLGFQLSHTKLNGYDIQSQLIGQHMAHCICAMTTHHIFNRKLHIMQIYAILAKKHEQFTSAGVVCIQIQT